MLNRVALMGRIVRDPELKTTQGGKSVCTITLAVERDFADSNGVREADFIDVVCWGKTAEFVSRYYRKGMLVAVDGRLQTRKWQDKYQQNRVSVEVVADHCYFAERSDSGSRPEAPTPGKPAASTAPPRGWNPNAADVYKDETDGYAGDLSRDRAFAEYNRQQALPRTDFADFDDDDDVPF